MELKILFKLLSENKKSLLGYAVAGLLIGFGLYYLPAKYLASGSFYVKRGVDRNPAYFNYEGYYAQQSAVSFTNTVAALLESEDIQSQALIDLGIEADADNLHKYSRSVKVKKAAPQLITLTVKGNSPQAVTAFWGALAKELSTTVSDINVSGDDRLGISAVSERPVVKTSYRSLWINVPAGIIAGLLLGVFLIVQKEYA